MPISLENIRLKLSRRLKTLDAAFQRHLIERSQKHRVDQYALQEGLSSHLWQYWCTFCRDMIVASAQGAVTTSGVVTTSPFSNKTDMEVAYIANKLANQKPIGTIRPLSGSHLEPTWGDSMKINLITNGIGSSNQAALAAAFGSMSRISDLQICRNACAHVNSDNYQKIRAAAVRYRSTKINHPSDFIFWVDPLTSDFVWNSWLDEIELASSFAVN